MLPGLWVAHVPPVAPPPPVEATAVVAKAPRLHRALLHGEAAAARDAADAAFRRHARGVLESLLKRVATARSEAATAAAYYSRTLPWLEEEHARLRVEISKLEEERAASAAREEELRAAAAAAAEALAEPTIEVPADLEAEFFGGVQ